MNGLPGHEVLDDVASAVIEFTGVDLVQRIVLTHCGGPDVAVDGRNTRIGFHIVEIGLCGPDQGSGLADIEKPRTSTWELKVPVVTTSTRRAASTGSFFPDDINDLFSGDHHHVAPLDFLIDLFVGFIDLKFFGQNETLVCAVLNDGQGKRLYSAFSMPSSFDVMLFLIQEASHHCNGSTNTL